MKPHYKNDDNINYNIHSIIESSVESINLLWLFNETDDEFDENCSFSETSLELKENLFKIIISILKDELFDTESKNKPSILDAFQVKLIFL